MFNDLYFNEDIVCSSIACVSQRLYELESNYVGSEHKVKTLSQAIYELIPLKFCTASCIEISLTLFSKNYVQETEKNCYAHRRILNYTRS